MARAMRATFVCFCVVAALGIVGCGDSGNGGDGGDTTEITVTRDEAIEILLQQGYTQAAAECAIDNAKRQNVDVMDVFNRDQVTQREAQVLAAVGEFCLKNFGTTGTTVPAASGG
jgi:hypothetical protein